MKQLMIAMLLLTSSKLFAQDTTGLAKAMHMLNTALLQKDTVVLQQLIDEHITYGHSNAWVQTKKDLVKDFTSGKIEYKKITYEDAATFTVNKQAIAVTYKSSVAGVVNGFVFDMHLQIMQVWKKEKHGWKLIARQSVKL